MKKRVKKSNARILICERQLLLLPKNEAYQEGCRKAIELTRTESLWREASIEGEFIHTFAASAKAKGEAL